EGTSVSTLSVETSSRGSSTSTVSPTALSHWVTVPSVTDSPRAGIFTASDIIRPSSLGGPSVVRVERLAGQRERCLADGLVLGRVSVDEGGEVLGVRLPVHGELALDDEFTGAGPHGVEADDRTVLLADQLDEAGRAEDLRLAVAGEVEVDG